MKRSSNYYSRTFDPSMYSTGTNGGSPFGYEDNPSNRRQTWQNQSEELLERSTDRQIEELSQTVGSLRRVGEEINIEIGRSNRLLDELHSGVDDTESLLNTAFKQLKRIGESGSNRLMCYLVLFVVFIFLLLYFSISWLSRR